MCALLTARRQPGYFNRENHFCSPVGGGSAWIRWRRFKNS